MKRLISLAAMTWCLFVVSCMAADKSKSSTDQSKDAKTGDTYYVVEYSGYDGQITNRMLSAEEYKALKTAVDAETSAMFKEALKLAEQDWQSSPSKNKPFPKDAICKKKLKFVQQFTDMTKATDRVKAMDDKQKKKQDAENKRITDQQNTMKESDAQKAEDAKKKKEVEGVHNLARTIFGKRMIEQLGKSSSGTNAAPAQARSPAAAPTK